ncbi:MAG: GNAT family N-acetyltransferase [Acidobacteria bacterium]|nr:GNAT family N-acetyltransferase [Acidobacteriota bacterium]
MTKEAKEAKEYQRRQVQRSMFRTVARNLIQQLQDSGCPPDELVGFANEILQTIIDRGFDSPGEDSPAEDRPAKDSLAEPDQGNGLVSRVAGLAPLSGRGTTPLAEGTYLAPLSRDDVPTLKRWLDDQAVSQSLAEHTLPAIIEAADAGAPRPDQAAFVLHRDRDGKPVGLVALIHIDNRARQAELVKMIGEPDQRGKGLAKKGTQMLVDYGFGELKLNRIYLRTLGGNMKNIRLNESLGFRFEGVLRQGAWVGGKLSDVVIMGMVAADLNGSK